jgi:hypothetical protein
MLKNYKFEIIGILVAFIVINFCVYNIVKTLIYIFK